MKRIWVYMFVCLMVSSSATAQDNPLKALWPFGKKQPTTPTFDNISPFISPTKTKPAGDDKAFRLPSPTAMIDKAEKQTGAVFQKTRNTWKGVQNFGKSLNPFAAKPAPKKKKSLLDTIFPKTPADAGPATVNDFLKLERPKY